MVQQVEFSLTPQRKGFHLVTQEIMKNLPTLPEQGILNLFVKHTSCALSINENYDPSVRSDMEQIYLRAYITSEQLSEVELGQKVTVYSDYGKDVRKEYPGVVTWISDSSEFTPKTILTKDERANLVYAIKVAVKNDGMLKIGMYGGVDFSN